MMCEGGTDFGRGDGSVVACSAAPSIYFGSPTPTWLGALSADLSWKRWKLAGVAEFQGGHSVVDGNVGDGPTTCMPLPLSERLAAGG